MKTLAVQKGQPISFLLKKNNKKDVKIKHGATWQIFTTLQKTWTLQKKKRIYGFLNCYHFAYSGRDTTNIAISQLNRIALGLIRKTSNLESEIDQIAQRRIKQVINQGGWENWTSCSKNHKSCYQWTLQNAISIARAIWMKKSDCNSTQSQNYLVWKRRLNDLAKLANWLSYVLSTYLYWLYVLVMSRMRFKVNPHSIVAWISRNSLLEVDTKSEV